ncbi:hypothetical protein ABT337_18370 [Saccharopolyspora hirsuta]|uniref:DUF4386 family protein n=1 Tax=Saccharopolyspora hirsuta TaxID=1837 RepID=A0A5M7BL65_SACHI|nr:hypothetical protein [Saccharopolyspora hirsuta]KAA5830502.1 hypothetical protein F1721_21735 [Saccharopolyspora hirsuta]
MSNGHEMRWGGLAGLASLVLALVASILLRGAPRVTESTDQIASYLFFSRGLVMTAVLLAAAAVVLFMWFGATLATAFRLADPDSDASAVVLGGFAITATAGFLATAIFGGMVQALTTHPMLLALSSVPYTALVVVRAIAGLALALPLAACAVAIARTDVFPQWAGWFTGFVALIRVLGAITVIGGGGVLAPDGVLASYVPNALTALWLLVMSGLLVREHLPSISPQRRGAVGPA